MEWRSKGAVGSWAVDGEWVADVELRPGRYCWWVNGPPDPLATLAEGTAPTEETARMLAEAAVARLRAERGKGRVEGGTATRI